MNKKIESLNELLRNVHGDAARIESQLQDAWNDVFKDIGPLQKAVRDVENSNEYERNEFGDICSWVRFDFKPFEDCKEYLKNYLREFHCIDVDFQTDALTLSHGDDNIMIQDESGRDNGVWQSHDLIIKESEYKDEETGEIDEVKRNQLIEQHMEKTGYFPGVFRADYYGNISAVDTKENS